MGDFVGGITDAIGLTDHKGEKRAAQAAVAAQNQANEMSKENIDFAKEQVEFQKEQYADWEAVYGDLQDNLGDYYNSLDPDKIVAMGLENQQREFQTVQKSIERDFAQRGLADSGAEIAVTSQNKVSNARTRAEIRTRGDASVAEEKMKFLGLGLGQGGQMLGTVAATGGQVGNAYGVGINSTSNSASSYLKRSTQLGVQGMQTMGEVYGAIAGNASDETQKENIVYEGLENGHKMYTFNYIGSKQRYRGVMAQEVMEYIPEAVTKDKDGFYKVDYSKLGVKMEAV